MGRSHADWTVDQLKNILKERGLPVSGSKRVLIERLEDDMDSGKTGFEVFIGRVKSGFVGMIIFMAIITLVVTFFIVGNPDQIEEFESGASGVAIDDDNFVYVTVNDGFVKYSVIEGNDGALSLKEEYASPSLALDLKHLFIEDNYVYAVKGSDIYMFEDSGHGFNIVKSKNLDNAVSGIVVSGDYAYVSITHESSADSVEVYDVSNDFQHMGSVHRSLSNELVPKGDIKGLATNDEYLYALINSCFKPDAKGDENPFPFTCKDHIYVWKLETIESLISPDLPELDGAVPVDSSMTMRRFLWFRQWYSTIDANGDYVYLGDDGWGTGIVVVDFSDYEDPKKVHSYGRTIDEYPSGNYEGAGIAANDDFIVVSTTGEPTFKEGPSISGSGDGLYIGKIDGDDDGVPLGKDSFPDWKYFNSNWELCGFLILILGLPLLIFDGSTAITYQKIKKTEGRAEAELHITKLKDTINMLKSNGIDTAYMENILAQCEKEMGVSTSLSFLKASKLAKKAKADGMALKLQHQATVKKIDQIKAKIAEFKEKGVTTDKLENVLKKAEKKVGK